MATNSGEKSGDVTDIFLLLFIRYGISNRCMGEKAMAIIVNTANNV